MSEDPTGQIPPNGPSFEERVLAELAALASRMDRLEEKVDRRLAETRPIWERVLTQIEQINTEIARINVELKRLNAKIDNLYKDHFELKTDTTLLTGRIDQLEKTRQT